MCRTYFSAPVMVGFVCWLWHLSFPPLFAGPVRNDSSRFGTMTGVRRGVAGQPGYTVRPSIFLESFKGARAAAMPSPSEYTPLVGSVRRR